MESWLNTPIPKQSFRQRFASFLSLLGMYALLVVGLAGIGLVALSEYVRFMAWWRIAFGSH
jgi:hypothetical protein